MQKSIEIPDISKVDVCGLSGFWPISTIGHKVPKVSATKLRHLMNRPPETCAKSLVGPAKSARNALFIAWR